MTSLVLAIALLLQTPAIDVKGVIVADKGSLPSPIFAKTQYNFGGRWGSHSTRVGPDGTFVFHLSRGEYTLGVDKLPLNYSVQSITYGDQDLLHSLLKVDGSPAKKLRVTLHKEAVAANSFAVTGKVANLPGRSWFQQTPGVQLHLGSNQIQTAMGKDGSFKFKKVPPGSYLAEVTGIALPGSGASVSVPVAVVDKDVESLVIKLPERTEVFTTIKVVDANGKPAKASAELRGIGIVFKTAGRASIGMNSVRTLVPPGDQSISYTNIPPNYSIKSVVAGKTDLTRAPLHVDFSPTPIEIQLTLERRK